MDKLQFFDMDGKEIKHEAAGKELVETEAFLAERNGDSWEIKTTDTSMGSLRSRNEISYLDENNEPHSLSIKDFEGHDAIIVNAVDEKTSKKDERFILTSLKENEAMWDKVAYS